MGKLSLLRIEKRRLYRRIIRNGRLGKRYKKGNRKRKRKKRH